MVALSLDAVQPLARRLEARRRLAGEVTGLAYGLCLVSGLRECEGLAARGEHGAVVACFYALTYLGFGAPYLVDGLNGLLGRDGTFVALAIVAAVSAAWTLLCTARKGSGVPARALAIPPSR